VVSLSGLRVLSAKIYPLKILADAAWHAKMAGVGICFVDDPDYTLGLWAELKKSVAYTWRLLRRILRPLLIVCFGLLVLSLVCCPPFPGGIRPGWESSKMQTAQTAHAIGLAMYCYANDNNQHYPDGNSSTEVFQKLIDGGYVSDPAIFYILLPGKIEPVRGQKLKPENVCWDVTSGVDASSPGGLPLLFMTGYKVTYAPGGAAVPIIKPHPRYTRTWIEWWNGELMPAGNSGIAAFYINNSSVWITPGTTANPDGTIPNVVSPDFKPDGKTYRQLTPDGLLPGN